MNGKDRKEGTDSETARATIQQKPAAPAKQPGRTPCPDFFIDRPIFAWVIAILITLGGVHLDHASWASSRIRRSRRRRCASPRHIPAPTPTPSKDRHPGHRAAAHRHRSPDVFQFDLELERHLVDHADLRPRHQSRYRAGADAEQGLARDAAPAGRSDAAGRGRRQGESGLLDVRRAASPTTARMDSYALNNIIASRVLDQVAPRARRRQHDPVRFGIRDAHLARPGEAARLRPVRRAGAQRGARAERAVRRRLGRRGAGASGQGIHGDGARPKAASPRPSSSRTSSCAPTPTARRCA